MRNINWDEVQEKRDGEFEQPKPGGYIACITRVEDRENKEYLYIEWDFAEGDYKGNNADTFSRAGFWPIALIRSYKKSAEGFFKGFKICVEQSNRGYIFRNDPYSLVGKYMGVVIGEKEYRKNDGTVGKKLYVDQVRSVDEIQKGDFTVPEFKRLQEQSAPSHSPNHSPSSPNSYGGNYPQHDPFMPIDDGELPF